jgi:hypothetical protein
MSIFLMKVVKLHTKTPGSKAAKKVLYQRFFSPQRKGEAEFAQRNYSIDQSKALQYYFVPLREML